MNVSEKQVIIEYPDKNQIKLPFLDSSLILFISLSAFIFICSIFESASLTALKDFLHQL